MKHSKLPWKVRTHTNLPCFIEAQHEGMPYALEIMGDDYNGFGDEARRLADAQFIVRACNAHEGLVSALEAQRFVLTTPGTGILPELANKALAAIDEALAATEGGM